MPRDRHGNPNARPPRMVRTPTTADPLKIAIGDAWRETSEHYCNLMNFRELTSSLFGRSFLNKAVHEPARILTCVDERCQIPNLPRLCLAGCGVLLTSDERRTTLHHLKQFEILTKGVAYHEFCGACKLHCTQQPDFHSLNPTHIGHDTAEAMAKDLGLWTLGRPVKYQGYSGDSDYGMRGHPEFHDARGVIVDGTGRFNPAPAQAFQLPPLFHISPCIRPNDDYLRKELEITFQLGCKTREGFGRKRLSSQPFVVLVIGDPYRERDSEKTLLKAIRPIIDRSRGLMTVQSVTAPRYLD